ncbi:vanadium-dependent haloperoxidase [Actinophytocola algeriensis]|uniref:PAP2 superfamily protein n=1 Tax=Actinophytocola algeriensis TaxID=1768010 RepID=A0A7W7Q009_9PSEU|nr:vanadium-dependent haloperoxidase [Actinophytocola algeriensis]MBB4904286.1 hypothetical protein [Actinophytocola algeriensis]MBE1476856.1 hypothetical protein [Actinophytocola algeriensis]
MTTLSRRTLLTGTVVALASAAPAAAIAVPREAGASTVIEWSQALLRIVRTPGVQPPTVHPTRSFAMVHAAMYRAATLSPSTALVAAVAQAGHDVLVVLYPSAAPDLDAVLQAQLATAHDTARGIRIGRTAARRMIELRAADGSTATPPAIPPGTEPGQYRPTPPAFNPPVFTHWSAVTPFVLDRADQFRPAPYPDLTGTRYADAINEVADIGRDTSATRTAEQTVQARFWPGPIQNYWNEIAQSVLRTTGLMKATRVFAQLNLTFADAAIAFYDAKYHYRVWRPVTAIRMADTGGNPATTADPTWSSLLTSSAPSYPGGHSVVGQAGATVLAACTGQRHRLVVTSEVLPGVVRTFDRLQDAADEAGIARFLGGVHTRLDHEAGQRPGAHVARAVLART